MRNKHIRLVLICTSIILLSLNVFLCFLLVSPTKQLLVSSKSITDNISHLLTFRANQSDSPLVINNANFGLDFDIQPIEQKNNTVRIPVLTYHHLDILPNNMSARDYFVSPKVFEAQLQYLKRKNYKTITPEEFYLQVKSGKNPTQKTVLITFDDGYLDNYTNAFPLLKKYGFSAVFYIPSNTKGISNTQLREMSDAGMIIDSHGKTHMLLGKIVDHKVLNEEILSSKLNIENITKKTVISFCYPGCEYNATVIKKIVSSNYLLAFSCGKSVDHKSSNMMTLSRMHVYNDLTHFISILSGKAYYPAPYAD